MNAISFHTEVPTLSSSAMILRLTISMYSGRKADKTSRDEITSNAGATNKRAASVYKSLFAGDADLEAINQYQAKARRRIAFLTVPWGDNGDRLVPTASFMSIGRELQDMHDEFDRLVELFVSGYAQKVSNAAFTLGKLFDRAEYPDPMDIRHRFSFRYSFEPVPEAGDFRVDLQNEAIAELKREYDSLSQRRLESAVEDVWNRVIGEVTALRDKLAPQSEDAKRRRPIYESTFAGFRELLETLDALNITGDPQLTSAGQDAERALRDIDIESLRESDEVRQTVHNKMQSILDRLGR